MTEREAISYLIGAFIGCKIKSNSVLAEKDRDAIDKTFKLIGRYETLNDFAERFCDYMLEMPCGCDDCPLQDSEHKDEFGNAICKLDREEDE